MGSNWGLCFLNKGQGVCDHLVYVTTGLGRGGWRQTELWRGSSDTAGRPHEDMGTIHSSFDLAEFVQSSKKLVLPRLVGVIEEETSVIGASLLLSVPGCPPPKGLQEQVRKDSLKASEAQNLGSRRLELGGSGIIQST